MFRILAALAFAVSFDLLVDDGKYSYAAEVIFISVWQHFFSS